MKNSGTHDITAAHQSAILQEILNTNNSFSEVAQHHRVAKSTVYGIKKCVVEEADKENIDSIKAANIKQPQGVQPLTVSVCNHRHLIRAATEDKASHHTP